MKIYKVEEVGQMGDSSKEAYFMSLVDAKKCLRARVKKWKKDKDYAGNEEDEFRENGHIRKGQDYLPSVIEYAQISHFYRCSYEYEEYDVATVTVQLSKIDVLSPSTSSAGGAEVTN